MLEVIKYGFYTVNSDYLEYLNKVDSEIYYNPSYRNSIKPFVGIIVGIENYNYLFQFLLQRKTQKMKECFWWAFFNLWSDRW